MTPAEAIELDYVKQKDHKDNVSIDPTLKVGDKVRFKLPNDRVHDISSSTFKNGVLTDLKVKSLKKRATDSSYSLSIHEIERIKDLSGVHHLYYLNGIKHGFTEGSLLKV